MATINRVPIREEWTRFEPVKAELFDECRKIIGYDIGEVTKQKRDSARLNAALRKAGIDPLNINQVERYKNKQWARAYHLIPRLSLHIGAFLSWIVLWTYFQSSSRISDQFAFWFPLTMVGLMIGLIGIPAIWLSGDTWDWKLIKLKGYSLPVPEFALNYALQIAKADPGIELYVEELRSEKRVADPFLVAQCGECQMYVAVWDEPVFEGRESK